MAWERRVAAAGIAAFVALSILVALGLLRPLDLSVAEAVRLVANPFLDRAGNLAAIGLSFELSLAYGTIAVFFLWRSGLRWYALSPLGFVALTIVELVLKLLIGQQPTPEEIHRPLTYPLFTLEVPGSFPSGHGLRSGFLCAFAALLLAPGPPALRTLSSLLGGAAGTLLAASRVYLGVHWISDVVGGLLLGCSAALLLGALVKRRLEARPEP